MSPNTWRATYSGAVPEEELVDLTVTPIDITPRPEEEPPGTERRRWPQQRLALMILAVLAAFGLGLVTNRGPAPNSEHPPTDTSSPNPADLVATGNQCSVQNGQKLQVGIEVANQGATAAAILSLQASTPLGGLVLRELGWGGCGQLRPVPVNSTTPEGQPMRLIPAGASDWMYALYDVSEECPAPYPVRFLLGLVGTNDLLDVGGFADLGNVPYTGCTG